jgi:hypothetical protein
MADIKKPATTEAIWELLYRALGENTELMPLQKLQKNFSGVSSFHKFYFGIRCSCKSAAILSIEVAQSKNLDEVKSVIPKMLNSLQTQAQVFRKMPCEIHQKMRMRNISS